MITEKQKEVLAKALQKGRQKRMEKLKRGEKLNPITKAKDTSTYKNCLNGYCYWCMDGSDQDSVPRTDVTRDVRNCTSVDCLLWTMRPYRDITQRKSDLERAIQDHKENKRGYREFISEIEKSFYKKPTSRTTCIKGKCFNCVGGVDEDSPRRKVRECEMEDCSLFPVRPWQNVKRSECDVSKMDGSHLKPLLTTTE